MKRFFRAIIFCAAIFMCIVCSVCSGCGNPSQARWQYVDTAMGTVIQQNIYASEEEAKGISREVMELLTRLEQEQISWRLETSEIYRLNASAGKAEGFVLSEELTAVLQQCLDVTEKSQGAFDVTIGSVSRLWNIDSWAAGEVPDSAGQSAGEPAQTEKPSGQSAVEEVPPAQGFRLPSAEELAQALGESGSGKIMWNTDSRKQWEVVLPAGMQLDLGAVGKGLALSEIYALLQTHTELSGAVISAGGSILTYGTKPDGSGWKVAIVDPNDTSANIGVLSLSGDWFVATSGDYERYVEVDGVRYHHILDPKTGYPANSGVRSVTILAKDGLLSDALSTACFVLGTEKGLELAAQYDSEVLFVLESGELVMSEGMRQYFRES